MRRTSRLKPNDAKLKTVCAWCTKVMSPGQMPITHGICRACSAVYLDPREDFAGPLPGFASQT